MLNFDDDFRRHAFFNIFAEEAKQFDTFLKSSNILNLSVEEITLKLKALYEATLGNIGVKTVASTNAKFVASAAAKCLKGLELIKKFN